MAVTFAIPSTLRAEDIKPAANPAARELRLVPFPKEVRLSGGMLTLPDVLDIRSTLPSHALEDITAELFAAGYKPASIRVSQIPHIPNREMLLLGRVHLLEQSSPQNEPEAYELTVSKDGVCISSGHPSGLQHGIATLRQLIRANRIGRSLKCVTIRDYPTLRSRGFLDDITRGPSPRLSQLKQEVDLSGYLRMNLFTYYLEHQFKFRKHPSIGPVDGSLTPEDLSVLGKYASARNIEVIGCQQSFGHMGAILRLPEFKALQETPDILDPTNEKTYQLLDDLYSEQIPLLPGSRFLVCCDETDGLGNGPSARLVPQLGVGGVYAKHVSRLHDLLAQKYHRRMMMWGDIILQHPEHLKEIPKDSIMLAWGYGPEASFEKTITPFKNAGFEFFVCPGVSNWNRILPDFSTSVTNIHNYIRDGAALGASGMINTTWNDDGETLFGPDVYAIAYGAECAWNGSTTTTEQFNKRIGAVLFGEHGDSFGKAIALLGKTHSLPGYQSMMDARFWQMDEGKLPATRAAAMKQAKALLTLVNPALDLLMQVKQKATHNREILDSIIFGAKRIQFLVSRQIFYLDAATEYARAEDSKPADAVPLIASAERRIDALHFEAKALRAEYVRLWNIEKRPYSLSNVLARYDAMIARYSTILNGIHEAQKQAAIGHAIPDAIKVGLNVTELGIRVIRPVHSGDSPRGLAWAAPEMARRISLRVSSGPSARSNQPVEIKLSAEVTGELQLYALGTDGKQTLTPAQISLHDGSQHLLFIAEGALNAGADRTYLLYYGGASSENTKFGSAELQNGGCALDNGRLKLFIGAEGAHIFRWEDRLMPGISLTQPGGREWQGFADIIGVNRTAANKIELLESGPVRWRVRCTAVTGVVKTFDLWRQAPYIECSLDAPTNWFACYDDGSLMGADTRTPGSYLFENGDTGPLHLVSSSTECQERRQGQRWCAKYTRGGPMIGLLTPEAACLHGVGPGGGMGAVFSEGNPDVSRFVIYGGIAPSDPRAEMDRLRATLDFTAPPAISISAPAGRP